MKRQFVQIKPSQGINPSAQPGLEQAIAGEYPQGGSAQGASPLPESSSPTGLGQGRPSRWTTSDLQSSQPGINQNHQPDIAIPPAAYRPITDPLNPPGNIPDQMQQSAPPTGSTPFASFHGIAGTPGQQMPSLFGAGTANAAPFSGPPAAGVGWSMNGIVQPPMSGPLGSSPRPASGSWSMNGIVQPPMSGPLGAPPQPIPGGMPPQPMTTRRPSQPLVLNAIGQPAMPVNGVPTMAPPQQPMGEPPGYLNVPTSPRSSDYFVNPVAPVQQPNTGQINNPHFGNMPPMTGSLNNRPPLMPPRKKRQAPIWAKAMIGIMVVLLVLAGGGFWYYQTNYADFIGTSTGQAAIHHQIKDNGNNTVSQATDNGATLSGGRINILLLGSDTDGKYGGSNDVLKGTPLAQTDIIVTIDPQTGKVAMLSIPRDLQVTQSNTGGAYKLDEIFSHGIAGKTAGERVGNAAGLVEDTLLYNFGIHINYYAWVSLQGFVKVIETAGGVDIDAIHPMVDDNYPFDIGNSTKDSNAYERLYIPPGPQHMNGPQALTYVRTRHSDLVGDFGRSARQQQILSDLKLKLATPGIVGELPQLIQDLNGSVITDMQLNTMLELANYAKTVDTAKIQRVTLGPPSFAVASQYGSNSNYYPNCAAIKAEIAQVFEMGNQANCIPQTDAPHAALIAPPTPPQRATQTNTAIVKRGEGPTVSQLTANNAMSVLTPESGLSAYQGLNPETGIHSMLDLVFAVTCESFDGFKV